MTLQTFLIAPYTTGLDDSVAPWLTPQDAFEELRNGYVSDGVLKSRPGYRQFAVGGESIAPDCQSRLIESVADEFSKHVNNGATYTFPLVYYPVREGDYTCFDGVETFTEDGTRNAAGLGILTGDAGGTGTIDYETGSVVVTFAAASGNPIESSYNYYPGESVTGLIKYIQSNVVTYLIALDPSRMNRYNSATNRFDKVAGGTFNGAADDLFSWENWTSLSFTKNASKDILDISQSNPCEVKVAAHNYKTGDLVLITSVSSMTQLNRNQPYKITLAEDGTPKDIESADQGNPCKVKVTAHGYFTGDMIKISGVSTMTQLNNDTPYKITKIDVNYFTLDGINAGTFTSFGSGTGTAQEVKTDTYFTLNGINSEGFTKYVVSSGTTEKITARKPDRNLLVFCNNDVAGPTPIQVYDGTAITLYSAEDGYVEPPSDRGGDLSNALHVVEYQGRLVFLNVYQDGTYYTARALYTGTGPNRNDFSVSEAGFLDASTEDAIKSYAFFKGELIVFFENSTWVLKKTGLAVAPFRWEEIDDSRSTKAPFGAITYLNKALSIGPLGIIQTDGYNVERADQKVPYFTTKDIKQSEFGLVYAGRYDFLRMHLWAYPEIAKGAVRNTTVLAVDYDNGSFAKWDVAFTCFGLFRGAFSLTWSDLTEPWSSYTDPWKSFSSQSDAFFLACGDSNGFVYEFSDSGYDDINIKVVNISNANPAVVKSRAHFFVAGDIVKIVGPVDGAGASIDEYNNHFIVTNPTANTFEIKWAIDDPANGITAGTDVNSTAFATYGGGGIAQKAIDFKAVTKQINPFIEQGKKARLAYADIYLSVSDITDAYIDFYVDDEDSEGSIYRTVKIDFGDDTDRVKRWVRVTSNQVANFHKIRIRSNRADEPIEIHGMSLAMEPVGSLDRRF